MFGPDSRNGLFRSSIVQLYDFGAGAHALEQEGWDKSRLGEAWISVLIHGYGWGGLWILIGA